MATLIFLRGLCEYVWANILTLSPPRDMTYEYDNIVISLVAHLLMTFNALSVPSSQRALTAAYVGARCAYCPGPPANPPSGDWHLSKKSATLKNYVAVQILGCLEGVLNQERAAPHA